jgi:hypothetical protein
MSVSFPFSITYHTTAYRVISHTSDARIQSPTNPPGYATLSSGSPLPADA